MKPHAYTGLLLGLLLLLVVSPQRVPAQDSSDRIRNLESRMSRLEHKITSHADGGLAVLLFGAFCALWAQNSGRNAWLWFFLGLFFNVVTVLVLLYKNSNDRSERAAMTG